MERPKIEDFKVEYTKGFAEIASARKQYSKAQDLYINHLEQLLIHSVVVPKGTLCEPHGCINYSQGYDRCDTQCKKCEDL